MRRTQIFLILLLVLTVREAGADSAPPPIRQWQDNPSVQFPAPAFRSQQIVPPVSRYEGKVYMPFSSAAPSMETSAEASSSHKHPGRVRKENNGDYTPVSDDFGGGVEYGKAENEFPIGEPWIMGVLAMMMVGWRAIKRRKRDW